VAGSAKVADDAAATSFFAIDAPRHVIAYADADTLAYFSLMLRHDIDDAAIAIFRQHFTPGFH
jgi:hypothetical protein